MDAQTILIFANPYEAAVLRRAIYEAGLDVRIGDTLSLDAQLAERPAAVLLDYGLSARDSGALLDDLRRAEHDPLPIVLIGSASEGPQSLTDALRFGADHLLMRPLDLTLVTSKLEAIVKRSAAMNGDGSATMPGDEELPQADEVSAEMAAPVVPSPATLDLKQARSERGLLVLGLDSPLGEFTSEAKCLWGECEGNLLPEAEGAWNRPLKKFGPKTGVTTLVLGLEADTVSAAPSRRRRPSRVDLSAAVIDDADEVGVLDDYEKLADVALALPRAGRIEQVGVAVILRLLHARAFSGQLILRRDAVEKVILFDDGYPVFARSNAAHDRLGELLLREGRIDDTLLSTVMAAQEGSERRLGALLVEHGVVEERELFALVRRHVLEICYSIFSWRSGIFEVDARDGVEAERIRLKVHPAALIVEGIRRKVGLAEAMDCLGGVKTRVRLREGVAGILAVADLEADELEVTKVLAGEQTIGGILGLGSLDELRTYQLVYALQVLDLVILRGEGVRDPYDDDASQRWGRESSVDGRRILAKMAQVKEGDYFAILGLRSDVSRREIVQAYRRLREELDPRELAPELIEEHGDALFAIREVLEEAFAVLGDDGLREAYRDAIAE